MERNRVFLSFQLERTTKPKRGRPQTPLLERLRVIVWSHHVMAAGGMTSVEEFENRFSKYTRQIRLSSGLWARYMRGEVAPQGSLSGSESSLVGRLDVEYPGTAAIFHHPLWELLDFDRLLGPAQLKQLLLRMGQNVWEPFVKVGFSRRSNRAESVSGFWKKPLTVESRQYEWEDLDGLDALAVYLIDMRLGYLAQSEADFARAMWAARCHFPRLAQSEPFQSWRRMVSALLVIEAMCIRLAGYLILDQPETFDDDEMMEDHQVFCRAYRKWSEEWDDRKASHMRLLSKSSAAVFSDWTKQVARMDFAW